MHGFQHCLPLAFLFSGFHSIKAEVTLTPSTQNIAMNSQVTLTCSYSGSFTVRTYAMSVSSSNHSVGSLQADCQVFTITPNSSLYGYNCPTKKQLNWTIKKVTRANEGDTWTCLLGFTTAGSENASFTINVKVPIQNVTMTSPTASIVTVNENTETVLVCTTSGGLPAATVRWYKDQGATVTSDDIEITNGVTSSTGTSGDLIYVTSTLRYSPTKADNGKRIYCNATNSEAVLSSTKPLLNVQYSPDSFPNIQGYNNGSSYKIIEGSQGSLSCTMTGGNPLATLTWDCYNSGSAVVIDGSTVTKTVTWTASRDTDRSCNCQSSHSVAGTQSVSVNVTVLYSPNSPTFKVQGTTVSEPISFIEGKTRYVVCESKGNPSPDTFIWTKGGITVRNGKSLTFNSVQKQDDGEYVCTAQNTIIPSGGVQQTKSNSSTVKITVLYAPRIQDLSDRDILAGSKFNTSCPVVKGNPAPVTFKWSRNKDSMEWNNQILHIESITKDDDMIYTCMVNNTMNPTGASQEYGKYSGSFHLNVWYRASVISFAVEGFAGSASVIVNENDNIPFTCTVDSNPDSNMQVQFNGKTIYSKDNAKNLTYNHNNSACLDAGVYTCVGGNQYNYGTLAMKELILYVKCSPRPLSPVQVNVTSALRVPAILDFTGLAYPVPDSSGFTWKKKSGSDWKPLGNSSDLSITISGMNTSLTISNMSQSDYGNYILVITNEVDTYSTPFNIIAEGVPETPEGFTYLHDSRTQTSALLQWIPKFNGGPDQTFVLMYKKTSDQTWRMVEIQDTGDDVMNHTLNQLASGTEYDVVVYAKNRIGNSTGQRKTKFSTLVKLETPTDMSPIIGGAAGGGSLLVIIIVAAAVFVLYRRSAFTKGKSSTYDGRNDRKPVYEDENDYGMQDNPMYESAGPRNHQQRIGDGRSDDPDVTYSEVDKKKLVVDSSNSDVYAQVVKPKKTKANTGKKDKMDKGKGGFLKGKKGKESMQEGELYVNSTETKQRSNETIDGNPEHSKQTEKKNVNKDGLIYADLTFNDKPKGQKKLVIHGLDSSTEYVEVDFTKKADPLPDSDDENNSHQN